MKPVSQQDVRAVRATLFELLAPKPGFAEPDPIHPSKVIEMLEMLAAANYVGPMYVVLEWATEPGRAPATLLAAVRLALMLSAHDTTLIVRSATHAAVLGPELAQLTALLNVAHGLDVELTVQVPSVRCETWLQEAARRLRLELMNLAPIAEHFRQRWPLMSSAGTTEAAAISHVREAADFVRLAASSLEMAAMLVKNIDDAAPPAPPPAEGVGGLDVEGKPRS